MSFINLLKGVLDSARNLLSGEPARLIGYGGAVVVYLVARAFEVIPDVSLDESLAQVGLAIALVASFVETIRRYVYSPNTVAEIIGDLMSDAEPAPATDT